MIHAQVQKSYRDNRIIKNHERLMIGPEHRPQLAMSRPEDSRKINTSFIERLNLTLRRSSCASAQDESAERPWMEAAHRNGSRVREDVSLAPPPQPTLRLASRRSVD